MATGRGAITFTVELSGSNLLDQITNTGKIQGYADDIVLLGENFVGQLRNDMNDRFRQVCTWCEIEGLKINQAKTVNIPITKKNYLSELSRLKMDGVCMPV